MTLQIIGGLFILFAVYSLASASGLFAERSGTINLAINGGMIMGAVGYVAMTKVIVDSMGSLPEWGPIVGLLFGVLLSVLMTSLLSVASINLKGDQIIIGTAINVLAPIISLVIIILVSKGQQFLPTADMQIITSFVTSSLPAWGIQGIVFGCVSFVMILLFVLMRFTTFGLRLRAAGENPHALAAAGVSVKKIRHLAMLLSGVLAGLAGAVVVMGFIKFSSFTSSIMGMGFLALAILILGQWRMQWIILGSLVFAAVYILAFVYGPKLDKDQWYVYMIPYVAILITLPLISRKSQAPLAEGIPYENTGR